MAEPIVYVDRSAIRTGELGQLKEAIADLVAFIKEREPQLLSYGFYIDSDASAMTVVAVHPDSESLERHLKIGGSEFSKVGRFIDLRVIEVFGRPSASARALLEEKAQLLGFGARVVTHDLASGFARFPSNS